MFFLPPEKTFFISYRRALRWQDRILLSSYYYYNLFERASQRPKIHPTESPSLLIYGCHFRTWWWLVWSSYVSRALFWLIKLIIRKIRFSGVTLISDYLLGTSVWPCVSYVEVMYSTYLVLKGHVERSLETLEVTFRGHWGH